MRICASDCKTEHVTTLHVTSSCWLPCSLCMLTSHQTKLTQSTTALIKTKLVQSAAKKAEHNLLLWTSVSVDTDADQFSGPGVDRKIVEKKKKNRDNAANL